MGSERLWPLVKSGDLEKEKVEEEAAEVTEVASSLVSKELKKRWSYFIRKIYGKDPLVYPNTRERSPETWHWLYPCGGPHWAAVFLSNNP